MLIRTRIPAGRGGRTICSPLRIPGSMQTAGWVPSMTGWEQHRLRPCGSLARLCGGDAARARSLAASPACCTPLLMLAHCQGARQCGRNRLADDKVILLQRNPTPRDTSARTPHPGTQKPMPDDSKRYDAARSSLPSHTASASLHCCRSKPSAMSPCTFCSSPPPPAMGDVQTDSNNSSVSNVN